MKYFAMNYYISEYMTKAPYIRDFADDLSQAAREKNEDKILKVWNDLKELMFLIEFGEQKRRCKNSGKI